MSSNLNIPKKLRKIVDDELHPGESIRWIGQPVPRFFTSNAIANVLIGIPVTSFSLLWMYAVFRVIVANFRTGLHSGYFAALFGMLFVLVGFGMLFSPLWTWQSAKETVYLVTDKRVITIQGSVTATIKSYLPKELDEIYRNERSDGTGDVIIKTLRWERKGRLRENPIGFIGIRNPRAVENVLKQLAQNT
jgi:hypothetical protein